MSFVGPKAKGVAEFAMAGKPVSAGSTESGFAGDTYFLARRVSRYNRRSLVIKPSIANRISHQPTNFD